MLLSAEFGVRRPGDREHERDLPLGELATDQQYGEGWRSVGRGYAPRAPSSVPRCRRACASAPDAVGGISGIRVRPSSSRRWLADFDDSTSAARERDRRRFRRRPAEPASAEAAGAVTAETTPPESREPTPGGRRFPVVRPRLPAFSRCASLSSSGYTAPTGSR